MDSELISNAPATTRKRPGETMGEVLLVLESWDTYTGVIVVLLGWALITLQESFNSHRGRNSQVSWSITHGLCTKVTVSCPMQSSLFHHFLSSVTPHTAMIPPPAALSISDLYFAFKLSFCCKYPSSTTQSLIVLYAVFLLHMNPTFSTVTRQPHAVLLTTTFMPLLLLRIP